MDCCVLELLEALQLDNMERLSQKAESVSGLQFLLEVEVVASLEGLEMIE